MGTRKGNFHAHDVPLKVVHVALQLDTGGMEKLLVEFARHANRATTALHFVSLGERGSVADELESLGWPVTALREPPGLRPGMVARLAKLFREIGADVVHVHNGKPLIYAAPAARMARMKKVVYTRHGQRHLAGRRQDVLYRFATRFADHVVCVSHDSAERSRADGIDPAKIETIWNGIDIERFAYSGPVDGGPVVMVGRLSAEKDIETLLLAAAIARGEVPDFRLDIAGDGACRGELQVTLERLGLSRSVRLLGNVADVAALLAGASMSVLSSVTEGLSLTLLEAMARGLPVVATRVGGNAEVVSEGETGLLVPPRNPQQLADALLKVWRNPPLGRAMGAAGRRRVEAHFAAPRMVMKYDALYRGKVEQVSEVSAVPAGVALHHA